VFLIVLLALALPLLTAANATVDIFSTQLPQPARLVLLLAVLANIKLLHAHLRLTLSALFVVHVVPINTLLVDVLAQQTPFAARVLLVARTIIKLQHAPLHQILFAVPAVNVHIIAFLLNVRQQLTGFVGKRVDAGSCQVVLG